MNYEELRHSWNASALLHCCLIQAPIYAYAYPWIVHRLHAELDGENMTSSGIRIDNKVKVYKGAFRAAENDPCTNLYMREGSLLPPQASELKRSCHLHKKAEHATKPKAMAGSIQILLLKLAVHHDAIHLFHQSFP